MLEYESIQGDQIGFDEAFTQAAYLLDKAGELAVSEGSIDSILLVAKMWMKLGSGLIIDVVESSSNGQFGFGPDILDIKEEDDDGSDESQG